MPEKSWGGKRSNAGRNRQRITLSPEAAKSLWLLVKQQRALLSQPHLTQEDIVTRLIEAEWSKIESGYLDGAEIAKDFIL